MLVTFNQASWYLTSKYIKDKMSEEKKITESQRWINQSLFKLVSNSKLEKTLFCTNTFSLAFPRYLQGNLFQDAQRMTETEDSIEL